MKTIPLLCTLTMALAAVSSAVAGDSPPTLDADSYNQWKDALKAGEATPPERIKALPGFTVERLRSASPDEGSWIAMAFDPKGRLIISREDKGLMRMTLNDGKLESIDSTLLEVRGLLFVGNDLLAHANNSHALYKLRDTNDDGTYDEVIKLRETPGGVGHGRNQLALGPDGAVYLTCGDDVKAPEGGFDAASPFRNYADDKLLPAPWDKFNWSDSSHAPVGHLVRTDVDGKKWEIICGGLRNPFGIAINPEGEIFTYDADIEWDIGLPSYRPTRILHLVSGVDFGWRGASRALPAWFPDTAPAVVDIGKGSPTGCVFGTNSQWPEPWKSAFFALDWAYGRIHAVSLTPEGATYRGKSQIFLEGRPLNVTSATFGPDGQMYFITGGRRTQSGLYRVRYSGTSDLKPAVAGGTAAEARNLRHELETCQSMRSQACLDLAWQSLRSGDSCLRRAARIAVENQDPKAWMIRAEAETDSTALAEISLSLGRIGGVPGLKLLEQKFGMLDFPNLSSEQQRSWMRALQLGVLRTGTHLDAGTLARLEALFPLQASEPNRLLCELLIAERSEKVIERAVRLCAAIQPQEDRLYYFISTGLATTGWDLETRRGWLKAFATQRTEAIGGPAVPQQLDYLRSHFLNGLSDAEKLSLTDEISAAERTSATVAVPAEPRDFVRAWDLESLQAEIAKLETKPDLESGKKLFTSATCIQCHRAGAEGGQIGPDLTAIGKRFDRRTILESVIEPWKVVADPYRMASVTMKSGVIFSGRLMAEEATALKIATNPIEPGSIAVAPRDQIASTLILSAMPPGLFNSFTAAEARDLLAWMEAQ